MWHNSILRFSKNVTVLSCGLLTKIQSAIHCFLSVVYSANGKCVVNKRKETAEKTLQGHPSFQKSCIFHMETHSLTLLWRYRSDLSRWWSSIRSIFQLQQPESGQQVCCVALAVLNRWARLGRVRGGVTDTLHSDRAAASELTPDLRKPRPGLWMSNWNCTFLQIIYFRKFEVN